MQEFVALAPLRPHQGTITTPGLLERAARRTRRRLVPGFAGAAVLPLWFSLVGGPSLALDDLSLSKLDPILRQEMSRGPLPGPSSGTNPGPRADAPTPGAPLLGPQGVVIEARPPADAEATAGDHRYACWLELAPDFVVPADLLARRYGNHATARLTLAEIRDLASRGGVRRIAAATTARPSLSISVPEIRADQAHSASGTPPVYSGYSGAGVVLGIVDTGIDFDHDDFIEQNGSRILFLWDQTVGSVNPPSQFGYGREWTQIEIDAGSSTEFDATGHGTHVSGTAGGNGAGTGNGEPAYQFVGVAPEATLVFVKTDFFTSSIVDAVDYVFQKAAALGLPAVVNLSLGHHYGPHDGTENTDLAIDALVGPGRIVVAAAGNEQDRGIHAEAAIERGETRAITLEVPPYAPLPGSANDFLLIDGYYTDGEAIHITVHTPNGDSVGPITPGSTQQTSTSDGWVLVENDETDPATNDRNFFVQLWDQTAINEPAHGTWTIEFENVTGAAPGGPAQMDCWLYNHSFPENNAPVFVQGLTAAKLVASPASADSVIAVAAYVTRNKWKSIDGNNYMYNPLPTVGSISAFSSHGPRRDGVNKPDLAAPGQGIGAALSTDYSIPDAWILEDGVHFINQGTSMAAPHVAGLAALMLDAYGPLSKKEMLDHLAQTARADGFTGAVPNEVWGAGKIDALAAISQPTPIVIAALSVVRSPGSIRLSWSVPEEAGDLRFRIERAQGEGLGVGTSRWSRRTTFVAEIGPGPDYVYHDLPLLEVPEVAYWLVPIESGRDGAPLGPYPAGWGETPATFQLSLPTPNPFQTEMRCRIDLPRRGKVVVEVIDAGGRRVRTLAEGELPPGILAVSWDGRNALGLPSPTGIYWIRGLWNGERRSAKVLYLNGP